MIYRHGIPFQRGIIRSYAHKCSTRPAGPFNVRAGSRYRALRPSCSNLRLSSSLNSQATDESKFEDADRAQRTRFDERPPQPTIGFGLCIFGGLIWTTFGIIWTGYWVYHGTKNRELVPLTGRSRYAGEPLPEGSMIHNADAAVLVGGNPVATLLALRIPEDDPRYVRVKMILERILASTGLQRFPWKLVVSKVEAPKVNIRPNAFFIDVPEGFISLAKSNDEIAFVLAHELGHILAEHPKETLNHISLLAMEMLPWIPFVLPGLFLAIPGIFARSPWLMAPGLLMFGLPFAPVMKAFTHESRLRERDADFIGMLLMADAGFDPAAARTIFEVLMSYEDQKKQKLLAVLVKTFGQKDGESRKKSLNTLGAMLNTHPPLLERIEYARTHEPQVRTIIRQNGGRHGDGEQTEAEDVPTLATKQWETFLAWRLKQAQSASSVLQAA